MITVTTKSFKPQLTSWKRSTKSVRDNLQAFLEFAKRQAELNNFSTLGDVLTAVQETKTIDTKSIVAYSQAHMPVKFKFEEGKITATKDKGKDASPFKPMNVTWYAFARPDKVTEVTIAKMLASIEKFATVEPEEGKRTVEAGVNSLAADVLEFIRTKQAA